MAVLVTCVVGATAVLALATPASAAGVFNPIKNVGNGLCLQPANSSAAVGEAIVQMPCIPGSLAQGWQAQRVTGTRYKFINQFSGLCMNAFGPTVNGTPVLQIECVTVSNEEWNTGALLPNVVQIQSRAGNRDSGFCIDVPEGTGVPAVAMQIFGCNGTLAQRWIVGFA
jgi:hypothetical protein